MMMGVGVLIVLMSLRPDCLSLSTYVCVGLTELNGGLQFLISYLTVAGVCDIKCLKLSVLIRLPY